MGRWRSLDPGVVGVGGREEGETQGPRAHPVLLRHSQSLKWSRFTGRELNDLSQVNQA